MTSQMLGLTPGLIGVMASWPTVGIAAAPRRANVVVILADN
jgi:hypothetical protein